MSDPTEVEVNARHLGWVPKEEWRGSEDKWTDAETFVKRGEEIMPILKKNNQELHGTVEALRKQASEVRDELKATQESLEELKKFHKEDTLRQVKEARAGLLERLKQAKKDGDIDLEVDLTDQLSEVTAAIKTETKPEPKAASPSPPAKADADPSFLSWKADNPWMDTDPVKSAIALAMANQIRADSKNSHLVGRAFFDKVTEKVDEYLGATKGRASSKVETSGGGASNGAGVATGRTYADLPADAKEVCERQSAKMVGEKGRAFKTAAEWKTYYVEQYFAGESA